MHIIGKQQQGQSLTSRLRSKFINPLFMTLLAASSLVMGLAGATSVGTAYAAQQQICGNGGSGYCMNDWSASGNVKMDNGNISNEDFFTQPINLCGGVVTSSCPFTSPSLDSVYLGDPIVQVKYGPTGQCVGSKDAGGTNSGVGFLTTCNSTSTGTGGGQGTVQVEDFSGCGNAQNTKSKLVNRYWSNIGGTQSYYVASGGSPGAWLVMNQYPPSATCWGGVNS